MKSPAWQGDWPTTQSWGCTDLDVEPYWPAKGCYWHCGVDVGIPSGTQIYAIRSGSVINVSYGLLGIKTDSGETDWYVHIDSASVSVGQLVAQGAPCAVSGAKVPSGGSLTGPHLHFESQMGQLNNPSTSVDPIPILGGEDMTGPEHDELYAIGNLLAGVTPIPGQNGNPLYEKLDAIAAAVAGVAPAVEAAISDEEKALFTAIKAITIPANPTPADLGPVLAALAKVQTTAEAAANKRGFFWG